MHTIVQTPSFASGAVRTGLTEVILDRVIDAIALAPQTGDLVLEIDGLHIRVLSREMTGAEDDVEVLFYFAADDIPVFLLEICFVGEPLSLTKRERAELAETLSQIAAEYRASARAKIIEFKST